MQRHKEDMDAEDLTATDEDIKEKVRRDSLTALTDGDRPHPSGRTGVRLQWDPDEGVRPLFTQANEFIGAEITPSAYLAIAIHSTMYLHPVLIEKVMAESDGDGPPPEAEIRETLADLTERFAPEEGEAVDMPEDLLWRLRSS